MMTVRPKLSSSGPSLACPDLPFAGKPSPFPEYSMTGFSSPRSLALGRAIAASQEVSMATQQVSNGRLKVIFGGVLLTIGSGIFLWDAGSLALHARNLLSTAGSDCLGALAAAGMALLHTLQVVAFDHAILFSVVSSILVLFSAFVIIAAGMTLLRKQFAEALGQRQLSSPELAKGDQ
jgi:hypothetical protein